VFAKIIVLSTLLCGPLPLEVRVTQCTSSVRMYENLYSPHDIYNVLACNLQEKIVDSL